MCCAGNEVCAAEAVANRTDLHRRPRDDRWIARANALCLDEVTGALISQRLRQRIGLCLRAHRTDNALALCAHMKGILRKVATTLFLAHLRRALALFRVTDNLLPGGGIPAAHRYLACLSGRCQARAKFTQIHAPLERNRLARWFGRLEMQCITLHI